MRVVTVMWVCVPGMLVKGITAGPADAPFSCLRKAISRASYFQVWEEDGMNWHTALVTQEQE